tara:strand:+ start:841 stop:1047 length:207 start_codon:yes stop_codon:yes gene_type:complete
MANPIYTVSGSDAETIRTELMIILASISDRLDAIEGQRGYGIISNRLDIVDDNQHRLHGFTNESTPTS